MLNLTAYRSELILIAAREAGISAYQAYLFASISMYYYETRLHNSCSNGN